MVDKGQKKLNDARRAADKAGPIQTGSGKLEMSSYKFLIDFLSVACFICLF